jgi:transposase
MSETVRYPAELRERAIRMVREHRSDYASEWAAIISVAGKLGIGAPETLRKWIRRAEVDGGQRSGLTTAEHQRLVQLERENRELRRANEILKAATVFFARELDPRLPRP